MKRLFQFRYLLTLFLASATMIACQKEKQSPSTDETSLTGENVIVPSASSGNPAGINGRENLIDCNTFYGPEVKMGKGHARSWINISRRDSKPVAIGIELSDKALSNLPTDAVNFAANTFVLKLHQKALASTPFNHITINWEPEGHEPPGIYDVPHFDMHFYKISLADQMSIGPVPGPSPAPGYLPASYVIQGATVPDMGTHWLDPSSPELPPTFTLFTHTFIYGSNNGGVIFLEPMITKAFLLTGTTVNKTFPQPMLFSPSATNYPTKYKIWKNWDNGRHYVALTDFVAR